MKTKSPRRKAKSVPHAKRPASPERSGTPWRRIGLYSFIVLAVGAPIAYYSLRVEGLMTLRLGPFHLLPLMLWPAVLAVFFRAGRGMGWGPPTLAATGVAVLYPVVVVAVTCGLALLTGAGHLDSQLRAGLVAQTWGVGVITSFSGSLLTVLGEEVGWRGFLQRSLEPAGATVAILFTSAVATVFHSFALSAPPMPSSFPAAASFLLSVFLLQVGLGVVYRAARSLWAPFLFHIVWNATNPVFTGQVYSGESGAVTGTLWLVNGEGLLGAAASLILLVPLILIGRRLQAPGPASRRRRWAWAGVAASLLVASIAATYLASGSPSSVTQPPTEPPTSSLVTRARAAVASGLDFLNREKGKLSVDAVYLLRLVEGALPDSSAGAIAKAGLPAAKKDPTYPLFAEILKAPHRPHRNRALPAGAVTGRPNPRQDFDEKYSDTCLRGALDCRWAPGCKEYKTKLGEWGYRLSHQVLFFLFAKEKKCPWGMDFDGWLGRLSKRMLYEHEQDATEFSDLFAERMGLGAYSGFKAFLRPEWIERIVDAQQDNGCWYWISTEPTCSDHATGMSAWVLALYLRSLGHRK